VWYFVFPDTLHPVLRQSVICFDHALLVWVYS
jgi:hypothetical protein